MRRLPQAVLNQGGTIFEDSKVPLVKWFMAILMLSSHGKGIASTQRSREISVTQKTAWFMLHRLRRAAQKKSFNESLSGTVEADETNLGGKEKNKHGSKKFYAGHRAVDKTPFLGVEQRDGEVRFEKTENLTGSAAKDMVRENVKAGANLVMDEARMYRGLDVEFGRFTVNNSAEEYVCDYFFHTTALKARRLYSSVRSLAFTTMSLQSACSATLAR